jgi:hypothetical protein
LRSKYGELYEMLLSDEKSLIAKRAGNISGDI